MNFKFEVRLNVCDMVEVNIFVHVNIVLLYLVVYILSTVHFHYKILRTVHFPKMNILRKVT